MANEDQFVERSNNAATALKSQLSAELSKKFGKEIALPERKVSVDEGGRSSQQPPPGSYVAMRQAEQPEQSRQSAETGGEEAQPAAEQEPQPQEQVKEVSEKAQDRIRGLVAQLREKDQALQTLKAQHSTTSATVEELKSKHESLEKSYSKLIEQNLENLDPDTRAAVMQDARLHEAIAASEQRILSALTPQLEAIRKREDQEELARVAAKFPGFDYDIHPYLIEEYRRRNPASTVEMAFKAVADIETLMAGAQPAQRAVPPVVQPGSGPGQPRSVQQPETKSDPETEMVEEAARARDLMKSQSRVDHKAGVRLFEQNIARRLGL